MAVRFLSSFESNTILISIEGLFSQERHHHLSASATSTNPVVRAIVAGTAPQRARLAAARGMLPLDQADLLEALVALRASDDAQVAEAAEETLAAQEPESLLVIAASDGAAPSVLGYLATRAGASRQVQEAVTLNARTPDEAIAL